MRRLLLVGILFVVGCQGVEGPRERAFSPQAPIDAPWLTIPEQQQRARDQLAYPEASSLTPRTDADYPAPGLR